MLTQIILDYGIPRSRRFFQKQRGFILALVMFFILLISWGVAAYFTMVHNEASMSKRQIYFNKALYLCEAGIEATIDCLANDTSLQQLPFNTPTTIFNQQPLGEGNYTVTLTLGDVVWAEPQLVKGLENYNPAGTMAITADELTMVFNGRNFAGGAGNWDNWISTRASTSDPWGTPVNLNNPSVSDFRGGPTINTSGNNYGTTITPDGTMLIWEDTRSGNYDLWMATKNAQGKWSNVQNFDVYNQSLGGGAINSPSSKDADPHISDNGLELYFRRGDDIWISTRNSTSLPFIPAVNLNTYNNALGGGNVNIIGNEDQVCLTENGLTMYITASKGGKSYDIYTCSRTAQGQPWSSPVLVDEPISTTAHEWGIDTVNGHFYFTRAGQKLYFSLGLIRPVTIKSKGDYQGLKRYLTQQAVMSVSAGTVSRTIWRDWAEQEPE